MPTNSQFLVLTTSLQLNVVDLRYLKQCLLLDQIVKLWNIKGFHYQVLWYRENLSLWQRLSSLPNNSFFLNFKLWILFLQNVPKACINCWTCILTFLLFSLISSKLGAPLYTSKTIIFIISERKKYSQDVQCTHSTHTFFQSSRNNPHPTFWWLWKLKTPAYKYTCKFMFNHFQLLL